MDLIPRRRAPSARSSARQILGRPRRRVDDNNEPGTLFVNCMLQPSNHGSRIKAASLATTNEVIFNLIRQRISPEAKVLDFGAGHGHMCQRLGEYFEAAGKSIPEHLAACEVSPEAFAYLPIQCVRMQPDSVIPFEESTFDLIYAIEVMEHTLRPYDFFKEAFLKLRNGGSLIFSTPNPLHFKSRLSFLFTGFPEMYGPPSTLEKNAGRICGHIMPLNYSYFVYGLTKVGFEHIECFADRRKRSALFLALMGYPFLRLASLLYRRRLFRYDPEVWRENRGVVDRMNRLDLLSSRSCIMTARKPVRISESSV